MIRWPAAVTLLAAGLLAGLFLARLPSFDISRQLDSGDLLDALVTILIAAALSVIFQRTFIESRAEKDLLMGEARETGVAIRNARDTFLRAYTTGISTDRDSEIIAALKYASMHISTLEAVASELGLESAVPHLKALHGGLRRYRYYLTSRAHSTTPYTAEEYQASEQTYARMQESLLKLMVAINKG